MSILNWLKNINNGNRLGKSNTSLRGGAFKEDAGSAERLKGRLYSWDSKKEEIPSGLLFESSKEREKLKEEWGNINGKSLFSPLQKRRVIYGISIIIFLLVLSAVAAFWYGHTSFDINDVVLRIEGSREIIAGDEVNLKVYIKNNSRVDLLDTNLTVKFPEGSQKEVMFENVSLGNIVSGQEIVKEFRVKIIGAKYDYKEIKAELSYQPRNFSSKFGNQDIFTVNIVSLPLALNIDIPNSIVKGQRVYIVVRYFNNSFGGFFPNMKLKIDYPVGFKFLSSEPISLSEDNDIWDLGDIKPESEGQVVIYGIVPDNKDNTEELFKAVLGQEKDGKFISYVNTSKSSTTVMPPLYITQTVNGQKRDSVDIGEVLKFRINFYNTTSNTDFSQVVITSKLGGDIFDLKKLKVVNGYYDEKQKLIIWNTANVPALGNLKAGHSGILDFEVAINEKMPIDSFDDKNYTASNTVMIDSNVIPLTLVGTKISSESYVEMKVNSKLVLYSNAYYDNSFFSNSGPLPLKVGQKTSFVVAWKLINVSNDLENVKVRAYLPSNVHWVGTKIFPEDANLSYNPSTGEVIWDIGAMSAATGILSPVKLVAFQVEITPSLNDIGKKMEIINVVTAKGLDKFTGNEINDEEKGLNTGDLSDTVRKDGEVKE